MKYSFLNDYSEGAHPQVLDALIKTNLIQTTGYGTDEICKQAIDLIKKEINSPNSQVHFFVGGTQTNATVISAFLRPHQGVISAECGHIAVHESGAIEATGHKILTLPSESGILSAKAIKAEIQRHYDDPTAEHMVQPAMVYISHPTEFGALYTKSQLEEISAVCKEYSIPLYLDGARLASAITNQNSDLSLANIAALTDAFYIGGTKMGALFGEALVITNPAYHKDFRYILKQKGAMLAKGRLLGVQFKALFEDGLYYKIGEHVNLAAQKLSSGISQLGYSFFSTPVSNQLFVLMEKEKTQKLLELYNFSIITPYDENQNLVRFCTSWSTDLKMVDEFLKDLASL